MSGIGISLSGSLCPRGMTANTQHLSPILTRLLFLKSSSYSTFHSYSYGFQSALFTCDFGFLICFLLRMSRESIQQKAFADHSIHASGITQAFCVGGKPFTVSSRARISDGVFSLWLGYRPSRSLLENWKQQWKISCLRDRCRVFSQFRLVRTERGSIM